MPAFIKKELIMKLQGAGLGYRRNLAEDFLQLPQITLFNLLKSHQKIGVKWVEWHVINLIKQQKDFR